MVRKKRFKPITTQSNHGLPKYPNLIKSLTLTSLNQALVSNITFIHLAREFVYLAVIMDLFSRRWGVLGWQIPASVYFNKKYFNSNRKLLKKRT